MNSNLKIVVDSRDHLGNSSFVVYWKRLRLFRIHFDCPNFMVDEFYVRLEPGKGLAEAPPSALRALRAYWEETIAKAETTVYCQVDPEDWTARRFVVFFGFKLAGTTANRLHFVRSHASSSSSIQ